MFGIPGEITGSSFQLHYGHETDKYQKSSLGAGGGGGQHVRLAASLPSVSQLSRKCGIPDISQPCRPSQPVTAIAFYSFS
jgi:hypothetical protein